MERFHKSIKSECIRKKCPISLDDAKRVITEYVKEYNEIRLHSAIGYITPIDKLNGKTESIHKKRDKKLENRRAIRKKRTND